MPTRRSLLASGSAALLGSLAGCLGRFPLTQDVGETGPEDLAADELPTVTLSFTTEPDPETGSEVTVLQVAGDAGGADRVEVVVGRDVVFTLRDYTFPVVAARDLERGERVSAVAVYENGVREVLRSRRVP